MKCDFKLVLFNFAARIKTHFHHNTTFNILKGYFIYWIEHFTDRGHDFSDINGMNITTINGEMNVTYEHYI